MVLGRRSYLVAVATALFAGKALAQDQTVIEKMIQMNAKALADYRTLEWDSARKTLLEAVLAERKAGLANDPVTARTYVNLGAVYVTGFKDRDKATESFSRALAIDAKIQLTPGISTPEMKEVFAKAKRRRLPPEKKGQTVLTLEDDLEDRDLPVKLRGALDCPNEDEAIVDRPAALRCALARSLLPRVTTVFLLYRDPNVEGFTEVQTARSRKGWYVGKIPKKAVTGKSLFYYFEGRDVSGKPIVRNGEEPSPNILLLMTEDEYKTTKAAMDRRSVEEWEPCVLPVKR